MLNLLINIVLGTVLFIGGYQFYFWCQRKTLMTSCTFNRWAVIDNMIPLSPVWIWFYTIFYYPTIVLTVAFSSANGSQFTLTCFSYMLMLAAMCSIYLLLPIKTPIDWRKPVEGKTLSERMLILVRSIDGSNNCFPSGHAAVTVITAYHLAHLTSPLIAFLWAVSIHISCLLCKQHYLVDLFAGASLGGLVILCYKYLLTF